MPDLGLMGCLGGGGRAYGCRVGVEVRINGWDWHRRGRKESVEQGVVSCMSRFRGKDGSRRGLGGVLTPDWMTSFFG